MYLIHLYQVLKYLDKSKYFVFSFFFLSIQLTTVKGCSILIWSVLQRKTMKAELVCATQSKPLFFWKEGVMFFKDSNKYLAVISWAPCLYFTSELLPPLSSLQFLHLQCFLLRKTYDLVSAYASILWGLWMFLWIFTEYLYLHSMYFVIHSYTHWYGGGTFVMVRISGRVCECHICRWGWTWRVNVEMLKIKICLFCYSPKWGLRICTTIPVSIWETILFLFCYFYLPINWLHSTVPDTYGEGK